MVFVFGKDKMWFFQLERTNTIISKIPGIPRFIIFFFQNTYLLEFYYSIVSVILTIIKFYYDYSELMVIFSIRVYNFLIFS
jgi:hypothetical protein